MRAPAGSHQHQPGSHRTVAHLPGRDRTVVGVDQLQTAVAVDGAGAARPVGQHRGRVPAARRALDPGQAGGHLVGAAPGDAGRSRTDRRRGRGRRAWGRRRRRRGGRHRRRSRSGSGAGRVTGRSASGDEHGAGEDTKPPGGADGAHDDSPLVGRDLAPSGSPSTVSRLRHADQSTRSASSHASTGEAARCPWRRWRHKLQSRVDCSGKPVGSHPGRDPRGDPPRAVTTTASAFRVRRAAHRSADNGDGTVGVPQHGLADRAEQETGEAAVPPGADDKQVAALRRLGQRGRRRAGHGDRLH